MVFGVGGRALVLTYSATGRWTRPKTNQRYPILGGFLLRVAHNYKIPVESSLVVDRRGLRSWVRIPNAIKEAPIE